MKYTSANMQPCKGEIAELHNARKKGLDYVREDLSHLNSFVLWTSVKSQMDAIKSAYEDATGQHLQLSAQPIQEIVVVTDENTTPAMIETFCDLIRQLGMTPLSYAIHMDEGHYEALTGDWIPNYHAHVIVDTTCWEHRLVERTKKRNGKNVIDPETNKPEKILVDGYAKTIKFTRKDMSRLQDFAAEATGLARPPSSHRQHMDARRYKAQAQVREIEQLAGQIEEQQKELAANDNLIRNTFLTFRAQAKNVINAFRSQADIAMQSGYAIDKGITDEIARLESVSEESIPDMPIQDILQRFSPLANDMVSIAMSTAAIAIALSNQIEEQNQLLNTTMKQIKNLSLLKTVKKSLNAAFGRPADKQIADVMRKRKEEKAELTDLRERAAKLKEEKEKSDQQLEDNKEMLFDAFVDRTKLEKTIEELDRKIGEKNLEIRLLKAGEEGIRRKNNRIIAENLIDFAFPEQIQQYESQGLRDILGRDIWDEAKRYSGYRRAKREHGLSDDYPRYSSGQNEEQKPGRSRGY